MKIYFKSLCTKLILQIKLSRVYTLHIIHFGFLFGFDQLYSFVFIQCNVRSNTRNIHPSATPSAALQLNHRLRPQRVYNNAETAL